MRNTQSAQQHKYTALCQVWSQHIQQPSLIVLGTVGLVKHNTEVSVTEAKLHSQVLCKQKKVIGYPKSICKMFKLINRA